MHNYISRRGFLGAAAALPAAAVTHPLALLERMTTSPRPRSSAALLGIDSPFGISLAEWSLHRALYAGDLDNLDFPAVTRNDYGLDAVEYVNSFFKDRAEDRGYLNDLKRRCEDHGVTSLLIMCDSEGAIGDPDDAARTRAVENHHRWVEAARHLGCHSVRVNAQSDGTPEAQRDLAADGLRRLTEFAAQRDVNVLVENHGGLSSSGAWLASVMRAVDHPRCGTLPDFGNFQIRGSLWYDRYRGVAELMPFAKAVSAKSHDFDEQGEETGTDFTRMLRVVLDAGYRGWIGIEYEGSRLTEPAGIRATKALLERTRASLREEYQ